MNEDIENDIEEEEEHERNNALNKVAENGNDGTRKCHYILVRIKIIFLLLKCLSLKNL